MEWSEGLRTFQRQLLRCQHQKKKRRKRSSQRRSLPFVSARSSTSSETPIVANDWSDPVVLFCEHRGITPQIGGVVSGSGLGVGLTHTLWQNDRSAFGWQTLRTYKGYQELGLFYTRELDANGRYSLYTELSTRDLPQERLASPRP